MPQIAKIETRQATQCIKRKHFLFAVSVTTSRKGQTKVNIIATRNGMFKISADKNNLEVNFKESETSSDDQVCKHHTVETRYVSTMP